MSKHRKKHSSKTGLPPGTLIHAGEEKTTTARITLLHYDESQMQERVLESVDQCVPFHQAASVSWINLDGFSQIEVLEKFGREFKLHPLVLEDILHTEQRPKLEDHGDYIYIVLRMLSYNSQKRVIDSEQMSLVLGSNFVLSFQEEPGDVFDTVRMRIRNGKGQIRKLGADYLLYALLDAVVDQYFVILEELGDDIEALEEDVLANPHPEVLQTLHRLKREMIYLRKAVWPLREVINVLARGDSPLMQKHTLIYVRDLYDHAIRVMDTVETFRDLISGMLDIYLSSLSNRTNMVMKVLTVITTIFMPLTLITGIFGMNFKYIPGLAESWGFFAVIGTMLLISVTMLGVFRRKKWI